MAPVLRGSNCYQIQFTHCILWSNTLDLAIDLFQFGLETLAAALPHILAVE
jgi:hypothetical protein